MSSEEDSPRPPTIPTAMFFERSTDGVRVKERPEFWTETTGRRMISTAAPNAWRPASARLRGLVGAGVEFLDYTSEFMWMDRTPAMCNADGREEVSVGLVLGAGTGAAQNDRELRLSRGDLYVIDFGRPVRSLVLCHHELAISLPRRAVAAAVGDVSRLGGTRLANDGVGALLSALMRATAEEATRLTPSEQASALTAASELALATLRAATGGESDFDQVAHGLYAAAGGIIERQCADPELTPEKVAAALGCSRASLYRLFAANGEGVAAAIWEARLTRARHMLSQPGQSDVTLAEIAYRCGFLDQSTFSRMFKRRYDMTPREAREAGRLS